MSIGTGGIDESELDKLFHIDQENLGARSVPLIPVYDPEYRGEQYRDWDDDSSWYIWVTQGDELTRVRGYPERSSYFGIEIASDDDVNVPFLEYYTQHLSLPSYMGLIKRIEEDVRNFAACLSKFALYQQLVPEGPFNVQRFVITELEYIFAISRSMYDLLQRLSWKLWQGVDLREGGGNELPSNSFARITLSGDDPVPSEDLMEAYGIPQSMADFYETEAEYFAIIRDFRDEILHHGESIELIFITEEGFSIRASTEPFSEFDVWDEDTFLENDLAPLWPVVAHVVHHTLSAFDRFTRAFAGEIGVLPRVAPDHDVYLRGNHITNLLYLSSLMEDDVWGEEFIDERGLGLTMGD